jgi:ribA/ribD-fused uncharacterized protein
MRSLLQQRSSMRTESGFILLDSASDVLSFFCPAVFTVRGTTFLSAWHYVLYHKALLCRDMNTAHLVKSARDLGKVGELEAAIQNVSDGNWLRHCRRFLDDANLAKFEQNPKMGDVLLATDSKVLLSMTVPGSAWCVGPDAAELDLSLSSNWDGLNLEGLSLMAVRKTLLARLIPRPGWRWDVTPEPVSLQHKIDICFSWTLGYCQLRPRESWLADIRATPAETLLAELLQYMQGAKLDVSDHDPECGRFFAWLEEDLGLDSTAAPALHALRQST